MTRVDGSLAEGPSSWQCGLPLLVLHKLAALLPLRSQQFLRCTCTRWRRILAHTKPSLVADKVVFKRNSFEVVFSRDKNDQWECEIEFELRLDGASKICVNGRRVVSDAEGCRRSMRSLLSHIGNVLSVRFDGVHPHDALRGWEPADRPVDDLSLRWKPTHLHVCAASPLTREDVPLILPYANSVTNLKILSCYDGKNLLSTCNADSRKLFMEAFERFQKVKDLTIAKEFLLEFTPSLRDVEVLTICLNDLSRVDCTVMCPSAVAALTANLENILSTESLPRRVRTLRFECSDAVLLPSNDLVDDIISFFKKRLRVAFIAARNAVTRYEIDFILYGSDKELLRYPEHCLFLSEISDGWVLYCELRYRSHNVTSSLQ